MSDILCASEDCSQVADRADLYCGRHFWRLIGEFILTALVMLAAADLIYWAAIMAWRRRTF